MKMNMLDYLPKGPISEHRSDAHSKIHLSSGCYYRQGLINERSRQRSRARAASLTFANAIYSIKYPQIQPWLHPHPCCSSLGGLGTARRAHSWPARIRAAQMSPSIHAAHPPRQSPPLEAAFKLFTPRGEDEANCLPERSLKHLLNASSLRLIIEKPPGRFFRRH